MCRKTYSEPAVDQRKDDEQDSNHTSTSSTVTPTSTRKVFNPPNMSQNDVIVIGSPTTNILDSVACGFASPQSPIVLDVDDEKDGCSQPAVSKFFQPKTPQNDTIHTTTNPSDPQVIVLDDDNDDAAATAAEAVREDRTINKNASTTPARSARKRKLKSSPKPKQRPALFRFSVSKNSGRITIHFAISGKSTCVNFELEQVLSEDTTERLMEAQTQRHSTSHGCGLVVRFDRQGIQNGMFAFGDYYLCVFFSYTLTN